MRKRRNITAILISATLAAACFFPITALAGASYNTLDNTSFQDSISNADWNNPAGDVYSENNRLVFPETSTGDTKLITKAAVKVNKMLTNMFDADYRMQIQKLPAGEEFVLACGLSSIEGAIGNEGNVEIVLLNNGGIQAEVRAYETEGEAVQLLEPISLGISEGDSIHVEMDLTTKQHYTVKLNGKEIFDGEIPVTGAGRLGFLQTGKCHVVVSDVRIGVYSYDRPENCNVEEHFDDGGYNKALLTNTMYTPDKYFPLSISVEKYNDDYVLMHRNSGLSYISTKYQYSNFEISFDIPYWQRKDIIDEEGNIVTPKSGWIGVTYGDEAIEQIGWVYVDAPDMIYFTNSSQVQSLRGENRVLADLANTKYDFFAEEETRGFSVKIKLVDAHLDVAVKWMEESEYETVASYELPYGNTPTGYIHIWGCEPNNFAIDNLVIKNLDEDPNLIETEVVRTNVEVPADYSYEHEKVVYRDQSNFQWYILIPCTAAASILWIAITLVVKRYKNRKETSRDEK